jgi:hypothetical protein
MSLHVLTFSSFGGVLGNPGKVETLCMQSIWVLGFWVSGFLEGFWETQSRGEHTLYAETGFLGFWVFGFLKGSGETQALPQLSRSPD